MVIELISLSKKENRVSFTIKKHKDILNFLADFLLKLGFRDNLYNTEYKFDKTDVSSFEDSTDCYSNNSFDVDIFYGHLSVIVVVRIKSHLLSAFKMKKMKNFVVDTVMKYCRFATKKEEIKK